MKVYKSLDELAVISNAIVTIGTYDGVHLGHRKIIERLKEIAKAENGESVILTFFPHPRMVLYPDDNDLKQINTLDERIILLEKFGIDHLIVHPFTKEFSRLSAIEFVRDVLANKMRTKKLIIGYNHRFGRHREGTYESLQELAPVYNFSVEKISEQDINNITISSTNIREALLKGDIQTANVFLGYNFSLTGTVVEGDKLGRTLGFPTANIEVKEKYKLIPTQGIYAVNILLKDKEYRGMLYIGNRPIVNGKIQTIEVNIFDFDSSIYNDTLTVEFIDKIRDDIDFKDMNELKKQMVTDKENAIRVLAKS